MTLIVDDQGVARSEGPVAVPPGRHRAIVVVDDTADTWDAFIARTYGSLAGIDLARPSQGDYEQRDAIA
jgi:hypothetical protein